MSLFPKFKVDVAPVATFATPATPLVQSSKSSGSSRGVPTNMLKFQLVEQPSATLSPNPLSDPADASRPISAALEIFPDWRGFTVESSVLGMTLWVVRNRLQGLALAKATGHPAILVDDILRQVGQTTEEVRAALLPLLITGDQQ